MEFRGSIASILAVIATASGVGAATLDSAASGIAAPTTTITFNEVALSTGTSVTNQFASFGVTFTPGVTYFNTVSQRPNFSGAAAIDFFGAPVSIKFGQAVTDMSAAMTANFGGATFTTFLNGVQVEEFTSTLDLTANNFYGFTGSLFDEVALTPSGSTSVAIDNLSFTVAAVPVPASLPMLAAGLLGIGFMAIRHQKKA